MAENDVFQADRTVDMLWGAFSYSDAGHGRPVILLHGNGRSRHDWDPLLASLDGRRLIRPDLCGHGGSALPRERFTLTDLMYDVLALADELWLGQFDLVGHSLGGMIALGILRAHPERVGRIALLEGWTALRHVEALGDVMGGLDAEAHRAVAALYRATVVRWPVLLREQFWRTVEAFDAGPVLQSTSHPILEIYGDRGRPPPLPEALGVPSRPNIAVAWVPGGTHFLPLTHPQPTARLLRHFLIGPDEPPPPPSAPPPSLLELSMRR